MKPSAVLFVNCSRHPFIELMIGGLKLYETRTRHTLKSLLSWADGERILLAETGRGDPLVRCSAVIDQVIAVHTQEEWEDYLQFTWIPVGSEYDWKPTTKVKYLYHLSDVLPLARPFRLPHGCRRHGRVWAEYKWGSAL